MKSIRMLMRVSVALLLGMAMLATFAGARADEDDDVATPLAVPEGSQVVNVTLVNYAVNPETTMFKAGQSYTFVVHNASLDMIHEMVIENSGDVDKALESNGQEAEAEDIEPGQTKVLTWTFDKEGKFQLACHRPGHYELGMVQQINVEPK